MRGARWLVDPMIGIAVAVTFVCAGCDSHPAPVDASAAVPPAVAPLPKATAAASVAEPSDPKLFTTAGPLVAEQQADVAAERSGRIVSIDVRIGDRVRKGQLLAQLDDRELQAACASHKAHMASAAAQLREWQAEQLTAEADLRRATAMRDEKIISEENWEHAKYRVDETIDEVARFREETAAAQADLNSSDLQLEQSRIVAPFSGVIGRSTVRIAQEAKPGDVLFWVTAEAPLQVLFTVPETAMAAFSTGKRLELTTADYPALHQEGKIVRVSPVVDPASGSVQVIGGVVKPSPLLKPGMTMQVRLAQ
ncbi:MAG TPA: efflux RND transporter periplasmic adaptor subunit [Terracidiphilus sp.]|jgi:RND family efflux transporter MFP subunit